MDSLRIFWILVLLTCLGSCQARNVRSPASPDHHHPVPYSEEGEAPQHHHPAGLWQDEGYQRLPPGFGEENVFESDARDSGALLDSANNAEIVEENWDDAVVRTQENRRDNLDDADYHHPRPAGEFKSSSTKKQRIDWNEVAKKELQRAKRAQEETIVKRAKNAILFIGDGMGLSTTTAARWHNLQFNDKDREGAMLAWDHFVHVGLSITYNTDYITADSAGTATAFLAGEKTKLGVVGLNDDSIYEDCSTELEENEIDSIVHKCFKEDIWTGIVTTTRVTHATPAAAYAHSVGRYWESVTPEGCRDIASQMIEDNHDIRVIMGGGRREFIPANTTDPESGEMSRREDDKDLIKDWIDRMTNKMVNFEYVQNQTQFDDINTEEIEYLLALFNSGHMQYEVDRDEDIWGEPSLAEMVDKAIEILDKSENGYFLLVEGGRIDHGHHDTNAHRALTDTIALSDAINLALEKTDDDETLIIVSADHSHSFVINGYPRMDTDIYGFDLRDTMGEDGKPYSTLSYTNGPGFYDHRTDNGTEDNIDDTWQQRRNITDDDYNNKDYLQDAGVPIYSETHSGEDVAIYASGPMAHLVHGVHEQNYIAHVMFHAMCLDDESEQGEHCRPDTDSGDSGETGSATAHQVSLLGITIIALITCIFM